MNAAGSDNEDADVKMRLTKISNRLQEQDVLSNEEIEAKKRGIRDLKFKSEVNLGGVLST